MPATSIYLDHNATTPLLPEVADAMRACYSPEFGNPASQHDPGRRARRKLEDARERIGEILGVGMSGPTPDRVIFTSGGTEANNLAIFGLIREGNARHAIVSAVEHPSVLAPADELARRGWQVDRLSIDEHGVVRVGELTQLLRPKTAFVSVMLGQNETGVLQPVAEVASLCAQNGVLCHTDAAQVVGKLPVDFSELGVSALTLAAHKFHGPLGIGAIVLRGDVPLRPQLFGGFQQAGLRPGTESLALAVGMCRALELWRQERDVRAARLTQLRDAFESEILNGWPKAVVIGRGAQRLPHTSNIAFVGLDRQALFMALDQAGVACSTGSACASGSSEPSPAHFAMGLDSNLIVSALRFSLGATTSEAEVHQAAGRILKCCKDLGQASER
jgi:cysteine desulfurase